MSECCVVKYIPMNYRSFIWLTLVLLGVSCGRVSPVPEATPSPAGLPSPTSAPEPSLTPFSEPTVTPLPPRAVLLAPPGSDPLLVERLEAGLSDSLSQAGLGWEVLSSLSVQDLTPDLHLVILLPPNPEAANLVAAAPQTQFMAVGIPGLNPAPNLSLIGSQGERYDQQGFMAGLIAAMITSDWRVGVISISDNAAGKAARQGFLNGAVYFCGLCNPYHGPIYDYPLYVELPSSASEAEWQAAADVLLNRAVKTIYVYPGIPFPGFPEYLAQSGVNLLGGGASPEALHASWVATIEADPLPAILETLPSVLAGQGSQDQPMPIVITKINPDLFSPGRQALAARLQEDLLAGLIDTGIDPLTGDSRE